MITDQERNDRLKKLCTPEFLATLLEVSKLHGWRDDYVEIGRFVTTLHEDHGQPTPNIEPYNIIYPNDNS